MTHRRAEHITERVLRYLRRRWRVARLRAQRFRAHDYEAAWVLMFEAFYGLDPRPLVLPNPTMAGDNQELWPVPRWRVARAYRPLRRVVRRFEYQVRPHPWASSLTYYREQLECGHVTQERPVFIEERAAQRRRCAACVARGVGRRKAPCLPLAGGTSKHTPPPPAPQLAVVRRRAA